MRFNAADVLWGEQPYRQETRSWRSSCGLQQGTDQMVFRLWLSVQSKAGKADVVNKRAWSSWVVFLWSSLQTRHLNSEGCVGAALLLWCGFVEFLSRFVDFGCMWLQPHKNCWRWGVHSFWFSKKAGGKTLPFYLFLSNPEPFFSFFFFFPLECVPVWSQKQTALKKRPQERRRSISNLFPNWSDSGSSCLVWLSVRLRIFTAHCFSRAVFQQWCYALKGGELWSWQTVIK